MLRRRRVQRHTGVGSRFAAFFLAVLVVKAVTASAAISPRADRESDSCGGRKVFQLTGPIQKGAAAQLRQLLLQIGIQQPDPNFRGSSATLELDSPGGSLQEGIELAKVIREYAVRTRIPDGARCESACAVAFMAGKTIALDGKPIPLRELHPRGRLGFHAPSLPDEVFVGISSSDTQQLRRRETVMVGAARDYYLLMRTDIWPLSLIEASLSALKPGEMVYVDTVDKAGRWHIGIDHDARLRLPGLNTPGRAAFCINTWKWSNDLSATEFINRHSRDFTGQTEGSRARSFARGNHYDNVLLAHSSDGMFVGGMEGDSCHIELDNQGRILDAKYQSDDIAVDQQRVSGGRFLIPIDRMRAWHALPPETALRDIDLALRRSRIFSTVKPSEDTHPLAVSVKEQRWDHNSEVVPVVRTDFPLR